MVSTGMCVWTDTPGSEPVNVLSVIGFVWLRSALVLSLKAHVVSSFCVHCHCFVLHTVTDSVSLRSFQALFSRAHRCKHGVLIWLALA